MIAEKLKKGDEIRVVAPARTLAMISEDCKATAIERLEEMGLRVTFSKNCMESDEFMSSSVESRIEDLHEAFEDENVKGILTVIGGFNSNQLLDHIDYELIRKNPKILCGYSDITALSNAIYKMTGLVTYSGPHFSSFGMQKGLEYTIEHFKKCLMGEDGFEVQESKEWSDDLWFLDQDKRVFHKNGGIKVLKKGSARGTLLGGNLCTLNLLQGTRYMPDIDGTILFIEDDSMTSPETFDRDLQSLVHQSGFEKVKGIVVGRFQTGSKMSDEKLAKILEGMLKGMDIPVAFGADFGHTTPIMTFPVGGEVEISLADDGAKIMIIGH